VANPNWAKFQGLTEINNSEELFPFRVEARDGTNNQPDLFVIKVWAPDAYPDIDESICQGSRNFGGANITIYS